MIGIELLAHIFADVFNPLRAAACCIPYPAPSGRRAEKADNARRAGLDVGACSYITESRRRSVPIRTRRMQPSSAKSGVFSGCGQVESARSGPQIFVSICLCQR